MNQKELLNRRRWTIEKLNISLQQFNESKTIEENKIKVAEICCSFFGCGKILSREEKLFGDRCINHQKRFDYKHNIINLAFS